MADTSKRPRGAPPGNLNALKHGFYSRTFREMDIVDLEAMLNKSLDSEINMLRVYTRQLLELSQGNTDAEQGIRVLTVLGITATRLANIMRAQSLLEGNSQDTTVQKIIEELTKVNLEICKQ